MERIINLQEISDGKLYSPGDMVKVGCNDCAGCSECCRGMGNSIILDPYDICQLEICLKTNFTELMKEKLELNVVDGVILPNLKMQEGSESCAFLTEEGRCSVHGYRPGFCRMFPMGRIYEEDGFHYFLQVHECPYPIKTKLKLKKWLEVPQLSHYEKFIKDWHFFLKEVEQIIKEAENEEIGKKLNLYVLNEFYVNPYGVSLEDFFNEFNERLVKAEKIVKMYQ